MIDTKYSSSNRDGEVPLSSTTTVDEAGQLIIADFDSDGAEQGIRANSEAAAQVLGFSKLDTISPASTRVYATEGKVPATADTDGDYHISTGHTLITNDIIGGNKHDVRVYNRTTSTWFTQVDDTGAPATTEFIINDAAGGILEFHSAQAGQLVDIYARVTMSATERDMIYQQRHINNKAQAEMERVGLYTGEGKIRTDQYDPTITDVQWQAGPIVIGPAGTITVGGAGADLSSCVRVTQVPTVAVPMLSLAYNLPAGV